jgi:probable DNA repair protein
MPETAREAEPEADIDAWLRSGGRVVTASERAARALAAAYHRARRAEGLAAWPAPDIQDWDRFLHAAWHERCADDRMVLSALQEQSLWAEIVQRDKQHAVLLEGPRQRVARLAMDAHNLLCRYAPRFLSAPARTGWQQDAGAFSRWLVAFDDACHAQRLLSTTRLSIELTEILDSEAGERPPLLVAGFDRILPTQHALLNAWGSWHEAAHGAAAQKTVLYQAADETTELAACAFWCKQQLNADPQARVLVVTQNAAQRRGEMERVFQRFLGNEAGQSNTPRFEFSLGVPLTRVAPARAAHLILRWLSDAIGEQELDWLFSCEAIAANTEESRSLTAFMRAIRRRGWQRTRWRLDAFLNQRPGVTLPESWIARMRQAKQRLRDSVMAGQRETALSSLAWAELARELLRIAGWPGGRALSSVEFQVIRRWDSVIDACASLGFNGQCMTWSGFLTAIDRALGETLFAPESQDAPIVIAGPAESAGLTADAIWFMGASEDAWPASGASHPLLPIDVQREAGMPHASAQLDWNLAQAVTERLTRSAPELCFSYARQIDGVDAPPARLITQFTGAPVALPADLLASHAPTPQTVLFEDRSRTPFPLTGTRGGSGVLTAQSQCPFKAFATARIGAERWDPAEPALTAAQRGQLLHAVLHSVWSGLPDGIRSHAELMQIADLGTFVREHVRDALTDIITVSAREQMPQRYLQLEETRLVDLVAEWLRFEQARVPFTVAKTELDADVSIRRLALRLRLDRVDRLQDGTLLVVDYKSGNVTPKSWELPRPDDVQLPLYAGFAFDRETEMLAGLVFAKVRAGQHGFAGRVADAQGMLLHNLSARSELVKTPFTAEELLDWRNYIEKMADDFIAGRAEVDPREYPETCENCGLEALCRVRESRVPGNDDSEDAEEGFDE